ncbi:kinesin light chain [Cenococcum geophilum 1.58]|uniref:Kinesin light chain n=1 Tax=Cenococcum geophilum 1.58 TaxID=794803 RepID=A0ACC8ELI1_9PEZI|nr:kinesin light chain [Cenococcum geophilum 1.58]
MARRFQREAYTVGWVCALPIELAAAQEMLDEEHEDLEQDENDGNLYSLGSIGGHKVVLACLPAGQTGTNSAAVVAMQMKATFKGIRFGLMVGIGGGVPSEEVDIRLGDVVISQPVQAFGGVVQYDSGKATPSGFERTGSLSAPPPILLSAVAKMRANHLRRRSNLSKHLSKFSRIPEFTRASAGPDMLFKAAYDHAGGRLCETCSADQRVTRQPRESEDVVIHCGTIASGNQVMRYGTTRDTVSAELGGVLCFEMEAGGLMNNFPCLVIRGICDYADSHKNKKWQAYAAGTAAACAKEVLLVIPPGEVAKTRTVQEAIAPTKRLRAPSYYIPFSRNPRFVGRIAELDALTQKLFVNKESQKVTLVGLGGIGKTQVALKFAYSVKDSRPEYSIFWVPALSLESFEQACGEIARTLRIPLAAGDKEDVKELVRQYLSAKRAGKWLLVVDNADDMEIVFGAGRSKGVADYLPEKEDSLIVFTTRHQEVAVSLTGSDVVELEKMDGKEAVDFLEKSLIRKDLLRDDAITTKLLVELDYLPLAIAQAAAYINTNKTSISEYLRLLGSTEQDIISIMSKEFRDSTRYKNTASAVATTWMVSFGQIRKYDAVAADLLAYICCIEWKAIPRSILPIVQPEARMMGAIGTLCAYQFVVKRENEDTYDVHRLVHLATRIWVDQRGSMAETREMAVVHLTQVFPSDDYANRELWREYLPHAIRLCNDKEQEGLEVRYELCLKVGQCLWVDGRVREAVAWLEESYYWRKSHLAEDSPGRLLSQHELAAAYHADGQVRKAVELLEHVVAIRKEMLVEEHPDRLASQHELAVVYQADGQVRKAVELLEHVVAIRKEVLVQEHPSRLASQHVLAMAYQADGQVRKAVELLEHVVAVRKEVFVEEHPSRLASQHHVLASAYQADGQVRKAVEMLEHVVAVEEKVLVEEHPDRLTSQHVLAMAYQADGQVRKAVELLSRVVAVRKKALVEEHPDRLASQYVLAMAYQADGQVRKAVELLNYVVAVKRRVLKEDHPSRLISQRMLAFWCQVDA